MGVVKRHLWVPLLIAVALLFHGCIQQEQIAERVVKLYGQTMGTYWAVSIANPLDTADSEQLQLKIEELLSDINAEMSTYLPDSTISKFNRHQSIEPYGVSDAFIQNVVTAQRISEQSDGMYDITVAPLVNLWGFGPDKQSDRPTQADIEAVLPLVDYRQLTVDPINHTLIKQQPMLQIDLSSIAKGYAVDAIAEVLQQQGYQHFLVDIGGELLVHGSKYGEPWRLAVEQPVDGRFIETVLLVSEQSNGATALATSGNYRNFIDYDGERVVHTVDPKTGQTRASRLLSATVVATNCMTADAYATALMALGDVAAFEFAQQQGLSALLIYAVDGKDEFEVKKTPQWQAQFGE